MIFGLPEESILDKRPDEIAAAVRVMRMPFLCFRERRMVEILVSRMPKSLRFFRNRSNI